MTIIFILFRLGHTCTTLDSLCFTFTFSAFTFCQYLFILSLIYFFCIGSICIFLFLSCLVDTPELVELLSKSLSVRAMSSCVTPWLGQFTLRNHIGCHQSEEIEEYISQRVHLHRIVLFSSSSTRSGFRKSVLYTNRKLRRVCPVSGEKDFLRPI